MALIGPHPQHVAPRDLPEWTAGGPAKAPLGPPMGRPGGQRCSFHLRSSGESGVGSHEWTDGSFEADYPLLCSHFRDANAQLPVWGDHAEGAASRVCAKAGTTSTSAIVSIGGENGGTSYLALL